MNSLRLTGALAAAIALAVSSPAWSHHSCDVRSRQGRDDHRNGGGLGVPQSSRVSLRQYQGRQWRNRHITVEMSNITNMLKVGFTTTTFKPGDKVTVELHPLRDGRPGGNYIVATSGDGKQFGRI